VCFDQMMNQIIFRILVDGGLISEINKQKIDSLLITLDKRVSNKKE